MLYIGLTVQLFVFDIILIPDVRSSIVISDKQTDKQTTLYTTVLTTKHLWKLDNNAKNLEEYIDKGNFV